MKTQLQKYFYLCGTLMFLLVAPLRAQQTAPQLGPDLITNPGFEEGATGWTIPPNTAKDVSDEAHSGEHSLLYINADPQRYVSFKQMVNVQPGQYLYFSAWVKGKDVQGHSAAGFYMQSHDARGNYIDGSFPTRFSGTFDWKMVNGQYRVPQNAASVELGLYLSRSNTGTVCFDDVEVHAEMPKPISSLLEFPNYRGTIKQGDATPWKFAVTVDASPEWKKGNIQTQTVLTDSSGKVLSREAHETPSTANSTEIIFHPPANLAAGDYTVKQTFTSPNGETIFEKQFPIHVVTAMPAVYIDAQGFTVVNGERFFPLGVFMGPIKGDKETEDDHLQRIADAGFNTILNYGYGRGGLNGAYTDIARKHHLKVLYSIKSMYPHLPGPTSDAFKEAAGYIENLRNKPALLGWYTNDEMGPEWTSSLKTMYDQVKQLDPNHPAYQVVFQVNLAKQYFDLTDVLGTDNYPIGRQPDLTNISSYTRRTVTAMHNGVKGVWMALQMMDWGAYNAKIESHQPTRDELRNQAYQAIINGAKGMLFYTYNALFRKSPTDIYDRNVFHKRWPDAVAMAQEIKALTPAILHGKKIALAIPADAKVEAGALEYQNQLLVLLANPYYQEEKITLALPKGWKIKQLNQGEIKSTFGDGQATFTLPPVGSGVFRLTK